MDLHVYTLEIAATMYIVYRALPAMYVYMGLHVHLHCTLHIKTVGEPSINEIRSIRKKNVIIFRHANT